MLCEEQIGGDKDILDKEPYTQSELRRREGGGAIKKATGAVRCRLKDRQRIKRLIDLLLSSK